MSFREQLQRFRLRSSWTLIVPMLCLSGLLLTVGVVAAWQLDRIQASTSRTVTVNVSSMKAAEELEIAIRDVRSQLNHYLLTKDRSELKGLPERRALTDKWLMEARRLATTTFEQRQIQRVEQDYRRLSRDFDRVEQLVADAENERELESLARSLALDEMSGMLTAAHEYLDFNENVITESSERNQRLTSRLVPTLSLLGICGAVAGVLMGFVISRGVRQRVIECNVPIRDVEGQLNEVLGPLTFSGALDLDDLEPALRQIADRVQHVVRRLQDSERETLRSEQLAAVGQLAAGMAHELRNPLTSMKALVQSSLMLDLPLLESRDLQILEDEIDRMAQLIEGFLDYARPPQLEKRPLDLVETCQQTVSLILPRANQKGIRFTLRLVQPPLRLEADARQLRQVFLNLFENSLDATPEGGRVWVELCMKNSPPPPITTAPWDNAAASCADNNPAERPITLTILPPSNGPSDAKSSGSLGSDSSDTRRVQGWNSTDSVTDANGSAAGIHILVADSGCGIPPSLQDRIFQPFISTKETGLGLGLSICRRIVQSHGGQIVASNLVGGGSAFSIWLPQPSDSQPPEQIPAMKRRANNILGELTPIPPLTVEERHAERLHIAN